MKFSDKMSVSKCDDGWAGGQSMAVLSSSCPRFSEVCEKGTTHSPLAQYHTTAEACRFRRPARWCNFGRWCNLGYLKKYLSHALLVHIAVNLRKWTWHCERR